MLSLLHDTDEQEEAEIFHAALSFLEEFSEEADESDCARAPFVIESDRRWDEQQQGYSSRKRGSRTARTNSNKARDERKQELIYLRSHVQTLELQLKQLQLSSKDCGLLSKRQLGDCTLSSCSQSLTHFQKKCNNLQRLVPAPPTNTASIVWEEIARRQYNQRINAERENIRLKLMLESQIKVVKSLRDLLSKRSTVRTLEALGIRHHLERQPSKLSDAEVYEELRAGAEECYCNVDAVFESNGLARIEFSHSEAQIKQGGPNGMYLEIFENKILPFDMYTTGATVWHQITRNMDQMPKPFYDRREYQSHGSSDDTMYEGFQMDINVNGRICEFTVKQVLRRFVEEDRVVVVWKCQMDPVEFSREHVSGYCFYEEAYVVARKSASLSKDFTILQSCFIITPNFSTHNRSQGTHVAALADFVLRFTAMNISARHQLVENLLLEHAVNGVL